MMGKARHVPASARSCCSPLFLKVPRARRLQLLHGNPSKIRPKSDHFRECKFFNCSVSTTYNFSTLKCTDFWTHRNLNPNLNLDPRRSHSRHATFPSNLRPSHTSHYFPFLPSLPNPIAASGDDNKLETLYKTGQNRTIYDFVQFRSRHTNDLQRHLRLSFDFRTPHFSVAANLSSLQAHLITLWKPPDGSNSWRCS